MRTTRATPGRFETDALTKLTAQVEAVQRRFEQMNVLVVTQTTSFAIYDGTDHLSINCNWRMSSEWNVKQANAMNNNFRSQNNLYSNTYNPRWKNHPNFLWRNDQGNLNFYHLKGIIYLHNKSSIRQT